jgi:hypothetical protein
MVNLKALNDGHKWDKIILSWNTFVEEPKNNELYKLIFNWVQVRNIWKS